ncbi:MAG: nuclear transport factor 2 family protein [Bacteroidota bacterium]
MNRIACILISFFITFQSFAQKSPCETDSVYRQFDFWIGNWEVYDLKNNKAGDSKISAILNSCVILEEWTSETKQKGIIYTGKSFNTYNASSKQWQQTWVDNIGGSNEYLSGKFDENKIEFTTAPFKLNGDTTAVRRLTFYNQSTEKVRQHGEISKNGGKWRTEYDLDYRRKKNNMDSDKDLIAQYNLLTTHFKNNEMDKIADLYADSARIIGSKLEVKGKSAIVAYWHQLQDNGVTWDQEITSLDINNGTALQTGISKLVYTQKREKITSNVRYTLFWKKDTQGVWKIHFYHYSNL